MPNSPPEPVESPYQRFFWLLVAASISLLAIGVYTTITLQVNVTNIIKAQDKMSGQLDSISNKAYNSDNAASDRASLMNLINDQAKTITTNISIDRASTISLFAEQTKLINEQNSKITDLLIFKARMEEKNLLSPKNN